jgi:CAAX protease family protein
VGAPQAHGPAPWGSGAAPPAARLWPASPAGLPPAGAPAGPPPGGSASGPPSTGPLLSERQPVTPWSWGLVLGGLAMGFGPELLLYLASLGMTVSSSTAQKVTVGSAVALAISSLVMYSWQTFSAWLFSIRLPGNTLAAWGFRKPTKAFFWTIPLVLALVYVVSGVHDYLVNPKQQEIVGEFPHGAAGVALFVLVAVIMAPLFEEIFFRGFIFAGLSQSFGWGWGAAGSAAIFGFAHLQLTVFIPLFALGFGLAWVYKRTGSLWTSIALHATFNAIAVLAWALTS